MGARPARRSRRARRAGRGVPSLSSTISRRHFAPSGSSRGRPSSITCAGASPGDGRNGSDRCAASAASAALDRSSTSSRRRRRHRAGDGRGGRRPRWRPRSSRWSRAARRNGTDGPGIASQARALRARLTGSATTTPTAFGEVLATMRDRAGTPEQRDFALGRGAPPRRRGAAAIAEAAADVAELAAVAAAEGSPHLRPDATAAAALAEAAVRGGHPSRRDQPRDRCRRPPLGQAERLTAAAAAARARALGCAMSDRYPRLEPDRRGGRVDRDPGRVARPRHAGLGDRRRDGRGSRRLHPRQRRRRRPPARGRSRERGRRDLRGRRARSFRTSRRRLGHGTACAGIVRSLAPACRLHSVRVLGEGNTGSADLILGGLRYAIEQGFEVVNLSLSTTKRKFAELLHELADSAYFQRHGARRVGAQHAGRELSRGASRR